MPAGLMPGKKYAAKRLYIVEDETRVNFDIMLVKQENNKLLDRSRWCQTNNHQDRDNEEKNAAHSLLHCKQGGCQNSSLQRMRSTMLLF